MLKLVTQKKKKKKKKKDTAQREKVNSYRNLNIITMLRSSEI